MNIARSLNRLGRKSRAIWNRLVSPLRRHPEGLGSTPSGDQGLPADEKLVWSTLVTASQPDEIALAYQNLNALTPILSWSSLTVDGTSKDISDFFAGHHKVEFDNIVWLTKPSVVSRRSRYAGSLGHFNRISLNYLRGWLCNIELGEEEPPHLLCHNDGDWRISISQDSLSALRSFFSEHPQVVAISRPISRYLKQERRMWPDKETDNQLWFGTGMLSTNFFITPIGRFREIVLEAMSTFAEYRAEALERPLGSIIGRRSMVVAYPTEDLLQNRFQITLEETRKPADKWESPKR